jgi:hypothetical protein
MHTQQQEIWKNIKGTDSVYQVSNLGRVRSFKKETTKILKQSSNKLYSSVSLMINGKQKVFNVHQLVAIAFLSHEPCGHNIVVDHIDNNTLNNCLTNLQLITNRENTIKGFDKNKTSSNFIGVMFSKKMKKWESNIRISGKSIFLGYYEDEIIAKQIYDFAFLNKEKYNGVNSDFSSFVKESVLGFLKTKSSKYKGVTWNKQSKKWQSFIHINKIKVFLGLFLEEYTAHIFYEIASKNKSSFNNNPKDFAYLVRKIYRLNNKIK